MVFADLIGHERQAAYFIRVLEQNTAAHAYVVLGPEGVGKRALAERFMAAFLGVEVNRLAAHPDVITLIRPIDEKTGEKKRQIPLEHVRLACDRLALSAVGGKKVVLIEDADTLTIQAQNALLKTLEEPSGNALIILLAEDRQRLLRTILSRSVPVTLSRLPTDVIAQALRDRGFSDKVATEAAKRSAGRPGVALRLADADVLMGARKRDAVLESFIVGSRQERIKTIASLVKGDDAKSADGREQWLLDLCDIIHDKLYTDPGGGIRYIPGLAAILEAREALRENANASLALERVALALP